MEVTDTESDLDDDSAEDGVFTEPDGEGEPAALESVIALEKLELAEKVCVGLGDGDGVCMLELLSEGVALSIETEIERASLGGFRV